MNKNVISIGKNNFEKEVLNSSIPVLIDFWGSWCPPCKMMEPAIESVASEFGDKVKVVKLNVDQNPSLRIKFNIIGLPTLILFEKGKEIKRQVGAMSKKQILAFLGIE